MPGAVLGVALVLLQAWASVAQAAPVKQVPVSHFGREVNLTEVSAHAGAALEDVCTVASGDECQAGRESHAPGGFAYPAGVAVALNGHVYVADTNNNRVQELTATGQFVSMFGWDVNKAKVEKGAATQQEMNICTETELEAGGECQAGTAGDLAEQVSSVYSIAVDHETGNLYVQDLVNSRVDEYTAAGAFVLTIGAEVDKTTGKDVCTAASGDVCQAGAQEPPGSTVHAGFKFDQTTGNLLAVGGPKDLLYVGDEQRVQEFDAASGEWTGEISLAAISSEPGSSVAALALNNACLLHEPVLTESTSPTCKDTYPEDGDLYLVYDAGASRNVIRKFAPDGTELKDAAFPLTISPSDPTADTAIRGLALDLAGNLAVGYFEVKGPSFITHGAIYNGGTGRLITEFASPPLPTGLAFSDQGELYVVTQAQHEVEAYKPVPVAELFANSVACASGLEIQTKATFDCTLGGEVDPWGVKETEVWFEWGKSPAFGTKSNPQTIPNTKSEGEEETPLVTVSALAGGLLPNERYYYRLAGYDQNVKAPERPLTSDTGSFVTPFVAPKIVGAPTAAFVRSMSAVLFGHVNPENAKTEYFFEYAPGGETLAELCPQGVTKEVCPGVARSALRESAAYGSIEIIQEASGLTPATLYHYRLFAESEDLEKTQRLPSSGEKGVEGEFTTPPGPVVQAATGPSSAVTATSAVVSGSVNPGGQSATYAFELGVYAGGATQYGIVFSGPVAAAASPVAETLALTGLQPGTAYAYRIKVASGYGVAYGTPEVFVTSGLPAVLPVPAVPPQLPIPKPKFPPEGHKEPTRAQLLARALKACSKKPKRKRAACVRTAHRKYGARKAGKGKKKP
jgi:hypothetical protein